MSPSVRLSSRKGWGHLNSSAADNRMCSARHLGVCSSTCCHGCFVTKGAFFSWEILVITLCSSCFFRNRTPRSVTAHATCWASGPRVPALPSPFGFRYNGFSLLRYLPKASGKLRTFCTGHSLCLECSISYTTPSLANLGSLLKCHLLRETTPGSILQL